MLRYTKVILGIDIGGSHISAALVNALDGTVLERTFCKKEINTQVNSSKLILGQWVQTLKDALSQLDGSELQGVGFAMPGPFDYANGISLFKGVNKYEILYGINIKATLESQLNIDTDIPFMFENDAACFGLGEGLVGEASSFEKIVAITLGTGFGASFINQKQILNEGAGIPPMGRLFDTPFKTGIAEDYISSRWLLKSYAELSGRKVTGVKEIAEYGMVQQEEAAINIFKIFGENLAACLAPWLRSFSADCLVIGGSISNASDLF